MDAENQAFSALEKILVYLPYNTNRQYARVSLKNSNCSLFMPIRDELIKNAKSAKDNWERLANIAQL